MSADEMQGKYGSAMAAYVDNETTFDVTLCQAPCKAPLCWFPSTVCSCCAQVHMRKKALEHVEPGSGWTNYQCGQGYFGGCCCFQPGNMGESTCPVPCACLESWLCPGMGISATKLLIMDKYQLGMDEDDIRLIRCSNCLQCFACVFSLIACVTDCEGDDAIAECINCVAEVVFCCVSGCMLAQVNHEIELRENAAPGLADMER